MVLANQTTNITRGPVMKAILDLTEVQKTLFSGKQNGQHFLPRVSGSGYLMIKIRAGQLVTSSFIFGLLLSHQFQGVFIEGGSFCETHNQEIKRAIERYSKVAV